MSPIRIEIPSRREPTRAEQVNAAADILIETIRSAGLNPYRAARNVMVRALVREWVYGRTTRSGFVHSLRILAILNPSLTGGGR